MPKWKWGLGLLDELDPYKTSCDLGERDVLLQENDLRNHFQMYPA